VVAGCVNRHDRSQESGFDAVVSLVIHNDTSPCGNPLLEFASLADKILRVKPRPPFVIQISW
jgi:hypothetical protein